MKNLSILLVTFLSLLACGSSTGSDSKPDELAKEIFNALKNQDLKSLENRMFKSEEELVKHLSQWSGKPESNGRIAFRNVSDALWSLDKALTHFKRSGIEDFSKMKLTDIKYQDISQNGAIRFKDIQIYFEYEDYIGAFLITYFAKTERGWLIAGGTQYPTLEKK